MLKVQKSVLANGIVLLRLSGRITLGPDCQQIESEIDRLASARQTNLIFDLTDVNYMDSTGIGTLVMCSKTLKDAGGQLRLAGAGGAVDVIRLTQTNAIVPTHDSVAEALAAFAGA